MAQVIIKQEHLNDIADAIRTKNGQSDAIYTPEEMAPAILNLFVNRPVKHLQSIKIINQPIYQFIVGQEFSLEGLEAQARYDDGSTKDITNEVVPNVQVGTRLMTEKDMEITLTYSEDGITKSTSYTAYVTDITIVSWSSGSNQQIEDMIVAADAGRIDLRRYWTIGDVRIPFRDPIFPDEGPGTVITERVPRRALMLMDYGDNYELETPIGNRKHGSFIVQYQYIWAEVNPALQVAHTSFPDYDSSNDEFIDSSGYVYIYDGTYRNGGLDLYCLGKSDGVHGNGEYDFTQDQLGFVTRNVKKVKVPILKKYNIPEIEYISRQYFLPTETEIFGRPIHSSPLEGVVTKQWLAYKAVPELKKKNEKEEYTGKETPKEYYTRSVVVFSGDQTGSDGNGWYVCGVDKEGRSTGFYIADKDWKGVAPAFVI